MIFIFKKTFFFKMDFSLKICLNQCSEQIKLNQICPQFDSIRNIRIELRVNSIRFESNRGPIRFEVQFEPNYLKFNNSTKTYPNLMNFSLFDAPYDGESSTIKNIKFGHVSIELLHFEFEINISNRIRPQFDSIKSNQASI